MRFFTTLIFSFLLIVTNVYAKEAAETDKSADAKKAETKDASAAIPMTIDQTVVKMKISEDVDLDEAVESMELRANILNMKKVAYQPLYKEYEALGLDNIRRTEIFQFCDAKIAKKMIEFNMSFSAYMPCRIILIEDEAGQGWLVMMNLDMFIQMANLPEDLTKLANEVSSKLTEIMTAGANGDL